MKRLILAIALLWSLQLYSQESAALMEEGKKLEQVQKEAEAFEKYKEAAHTDRKNIAAFVKLADLSTTIGARQTNPEEKARHFIEAKAYADAARLLDSTNAEALAVTAEVYDKMAEMEEKRDAYAEDIKLMKIYAEKALAANPNLGKAYNILGRWHYEMLTLTPVRKTALKVLGGGLPAASIDSAIAYFEKCKSLERYYCRNFLDLGKAYNHKQQYEKAIDTLKLLARLPTRREDDPAIKAEGAALLQQLQ